MKAVYVMEMPDECIKCALHEPEFCRATRMVVDWRYISQCTKPDWCPLQSVDDSDAVKCGNKLFIETILCLGEEQKHEPDR